MQFDPENKIVQLCAKGMELEGEETKAEALEIFQKAWNEAETDLEKFIAAHYLARVQNSVKEKLHWDEKALDHALKVKDENMKGTFPSLYLNIAKCFEDLDLKEKAIENYDKAFSFLSYLPEDGYGNLIRNGVKNGIKRMEEQIDPTKGKVDKSH